VTLDFLRKHKFDLVHNWTRTRNFSEHNPSVTPELVRNNPDVFWHWDKLTARANFSPIENPDFLWDWGHYHENPKFAFENVPEEHLNELDWQFISRYNKLTIEELNKYKKYIKWEQFSMNPNVTMKFVGSHPEFPWVYENLPMNANCTIKMLNRYRHPTHSSQQHIVNTKSLDADREAFVEREYKRHLAAYRIQQQWHLARSDPNYALCRKKLEEDYAAYAS
jgi:hypothetical protein